MALTGTNRGTGTHNSSALTFDLSPASNFAAGLAVLVLAVDNSDSAGTAHSTFTVTDSLGNTWTRRASPLYDPAGANAGVEGAIFATPQGAGLLTTSTVITVTFDANCTAKAWTLMQVSPTAGATVDFITSGANAGAATGSPTVTTGSITLGDMVIGALHNEQGTGQTVTEDGDTTNGSWSTQQTAEVGTTAGGMTVSSQRKVVTATATQTFNPTLGTSSDVILSWVQFREVPQASSGAATAMTNASATSATGTKAGAGVATAASHASATTATGTKQTSGTASAASHASATPATGTKSGVGSASAAAHASATTATGRKDGAGVAVAASVSATSGVGAGDRAGAAAASHASATSATGAKQTSGAAVISHVSATTATGAMGGSGLATVTHASTATATGTKQALGAASVSHASSTSATGEASSGQPSGAADLVTHVSATSASGTKQGFGAATVTHASATPATGTTHRAGAATVNHVSATSASGAAVTTPSIVQHFPGQVFIRAPMPVAVAIAATLPQVRLVGTVLVENDEFLLLALGLTD